MTRNKTFYYLFYEVTENYFISKFFVFNNSTFDGFQLKYFSFVSLFSYLLQKPRNVELFTEIGLSLRNDKLFVKTLSLHYEGERIVYQKE